MPVRYDLSGTTAIVTGGGRGIGRAIVDRLRGAGARAIVWDLEPREPESRDAMRVDVTRVDTIDAALARLPDDIDVLVNDAGYLGGAGTFLDHDPDDWRSIVDVNLIGLLNVTQRVAPRMQRRGSGRIVNMASLAGKEGLAGLAAYSAASAGVIAFTKALGRELAGTGVLVNAVAPGPIDTDMIRGLGDDAVQRLIADSPLKRLGDRADVAELVVWLCSDACRFSTGAVFDVSGGRARY